MPVNGIDRTFYIPPATNTDGGLFGIDNGIPAGMRFALRVSDAEIEAWIANLPGALGHSTRKSAGTIARARTAPQHRLEVRRSRAN